MAKRGYENYTPTFFMVATPYKNKRYVWNLFLDIQNTHIKSDM